MVYKDANTFWTTLNILTGRKNQPLKKLIINDQPTTDPQEIANILADTIKLNTTIPNTTHSIHDREATPFARMLQQTHTQIDNDNTLPLQDPFTTEEVQAALTRGKNNAPGPDRIRRATLKKSFLIILQKGIVHCVKKPGKPTEDPTSYRLITLLNTIVKGLDKLIADRIKLFVEDKQIIPPNQHCFRAKHRTIRAALDLQTSNIQAHNNKCFNLATFFDIEKAFDRLWHDGLILKLHKFEFPTHFTKFIASFLTNRTQQVSLRSRISNPFISISGTPQGSALSPILYNIFTSDILEPTNQEITLEMFADDTAIWISGFNVHAVQFKLQHYISQLEKWFKDWKININATKSSSTIFTYSSQKFQLTFPLKFNNKPIPITTKCRYLGIQF